MLRQILRDMYVDPEILLELPEEQKEMLFFKIRQEQIRRYYQWEDENEENEILLARFRKERTVKILEDAVGKPWTWVFGETPGEITVEEKWEGLYDTRMNEAIKAVIREEKIRKISATRKFENSTVLNKCTEEKSGCNQRIIQNSNSLYPSPVSQKRPNYNQSPKISPNSSPMIRRSEQNGMRKISSTNHVSSSPSNIRKRTTGSPQPKPKVTFSPDVSTHYEVISSERETASNITSDRKGQLLNNYDFVQLDSTENDDVMSNEEWQKQLRRFKEADERRSSAARRASLECQRQSLLASKRPNKLKKLRSKLSKLSSGNSVEKSSKNLPLPPVPRSTEHSPAMKRPLTRLSSKPLSRNEVIHWFEQTQLESLTEEESKQLPGWFHGLISRLEAENLLKNKCTGDFLIRVSDKIWGYALSYKDEDRTKHFLIDASEELCYRFFGNDQIKHYSLKQLIEYHKDENITYNGERLCNWVGQIGAKKPDYAELLSK